MTLITLNIAIYLLTTFSLIGFVKNRGKKGWLIASYGSLIPAMILHALILSHQILGDGSLNIGALKALSLTAFIMLIIATPYLQRYINTLVVLTIFAALALFLSAFESENSVQTPNTLLGLHIVTSMVAYSLLLLASVQAVLVYLRDRALKGHTLFLVDRLPPILRMERLLFRLLGIGFALLTISILTSFAFLDLWFTRQFIHKTVLTGLAWLLYGGILASHYFFGIRGRLAAKFVVITSIVLLLGITGTRLIQELIFHRV